MSIVSAFTKGLDGPWPCEKCGQLTQFAEQSRTVNKIYCLNPYCQSIRIIDKQKRRILEPDGTMWEYNPQTGQKKQVRR